jgi:hypothetical protein
MNKSTASLNFPDVNVWLAAMLDNHVHHVVAKAWWSTTDSMIAFTRFTEIAVLRLLTTHAAMDAKPLSMDEAWEARDRLFRGYRVTLKPEPLGIETFSRRHACRANGFAETLGRRLAPRLRRGAGWDGNHVRPGTRRSSSPPPCYSASTFRVCISTYVG